jgi:hypothetical protein
MSPFTGYHPSPRRIAYDTRSCSPTSLSTWRGEIELDMGRTRAGRLVLIGPGEVAIRAHGSARLLLSVALVRHMWWNYRHAALERIEAAKTELRKGRVDLRSGRWSDLIVGSPRVVSFARIPQSGCT